MKSTLLIGTLILASVGLLSACGPDNVGECTSAEEALQAAYDDCDSDFVVQLRCDAYVDYDGDCTPYFQGLKDSAECSDGVVTYDNDEPCLA